MRERSDSSMTLFSLRFSLLAKMLHFVLLKLDFLNIVNIVRDVVLITLNVKSLLNYSSMRFTGKSTTTKKSETEINSKK